MKSTPVTREVDVVMVSPWSWFFAEASVAQAAHRVGTQARIFMPAEAPLAKVSAVRGYGGEVRLVEGGYDEAEEAAHASAERDGKPFIPPFDDPDVIGGQGTVGLEIARQ